LRCCYVLEGVNSLKVEFVRADGSVVSFEQAELAQQRIPAPAPAIIEVPFDLDESDRNSS